MEKWRTLALAHLDAARPFLEHEATPLELFARELVVQGLDLLPVADRAACLEHAFEELDDDA